MNKRSGDVFSNLESENLRVFKILVLKHSFPQVTFIEVYVSAKGNYYKKTKH